MDEPDLTRRRIGQIAAGGALAAALALPASPATAYQGNMERALGALYDALATLREATPNKGGHRVRAMGLIEQAIAQVQEGIEWADEHGGGGQ